MVNSKGTEYRKKENIKRFFYPEEWNKFYNNLKSDKLRFYFNFLMQTGARYFELSHIEVRDIDFERHFIKIRFAKTRIGGMKKIKILCESCKSRINLSKDLKFCPLCGTEIENREELYSLYQNKITKRRRDIRDVKISDRFTQDLKNYIDKNKLNQNDIFKFPTIQHLNQTMKKILNKIGINDWKDFSLHNIRKTHENYLIATGSNVLSMRMHMGHSIDVASAHYISSNLFKDEEIGMIKLILDNLKV